MCLSVICFWIDLSKHLFTPAWIGSKHMSGPMQLEAFVEEKNLSFLNFEQNLSLCDKYFPFD